MDKRRVKAAHVVVHTIVLAGLCTIGLLAPLAKSPASSRDAAAQEDEESNGLPQAIRERQQAIAAELEQLRGHPWAGEYFQGDGLGANITVMIAPQAGVAATWFGCMGLYGANEGRIREQPDGRLSFQFTQVNPGGFGGFADEVVPVRWGARRYLIPNSRMFDFVNAIHRGFEPRPRMHGMFLLARGDETKPVTGLPALPEKFRQAIRSRALDVGVVKVESRPDFRSGGYCEKRYRVTVDHGDADGLVPGTTLNVKSPVNVFADLRIDAAQAGTATGEIAIFESDCRRPENIPDRHWTFTTGAYAPTAGESIRVVPVR
ncbi:hypothetical protein [Lysobacter fragariae]